MPAGFEADRVFEMEGKLTQMRCKNRCHDEVYPNQKEVLAMTEEEVNGRVPKELLTKCPKCGGDMEVNWEMCIRDRTASPLGRAHGTLQPVWMKVS